MAKQYTRTLTLPDGRRKYFRGATRKEAEAKRDAARRELEGGVNIGDNTTVAELAQIWYDTFKKGVLRVKSADTLRGVLNNHIVPQIGAMRVREVRPLHIQQLMRSVDSLSRSVQSKVLNYTRAIFQLAVDNGIISSTPVVSTIKAHGAAAAAVPPLTVMQTDALLAATEGTKAYTFIVLALYAGLRRGEVLGLRWSDINFETGYLHVRRSIVYPDGQKAGIINDELKTSAARRDIPLPWPVVAYLRGERAKSRSIYVLAQRNGKYLSEGSFHSLWGIVKTRTIGESEGYIERTLDFHVHPHQLRHTCITRWFEAGLDLKEIQYLAGHSTTEMTLRVYTHYDRETRKDQTAEKVRSGIPVGRLAM